MPTLADISKRGHLTCKCGGNAAKTFKPKLTRLARLLVVITRERAVQHVPMVEMDFGPLHGKYTLTGVGHCSGIHWVCTFKFNSAWYHYDDLVQGVNVRQVADHTFKLDGFENGV
jgi:hypothetical protein